VKLGMFASAWAFGGLEACRRELEGGVFDGIEGPPPSDASEASALRRSRVPYIAEICSGGSYSPASSVGFERHWQDLQAQVTQALECGALFCTCLVGSDSWPLAVAVDFFGRALVLGKQLGAELSFETHRSRPTFHPWATHALLEALPELRVTCDFSHWCVVCERLPDDAALALPIERARHLHARVGYAQGPQVPDPRAPEFELELMAHEGWWRRIAQSVRARGPGLVSVTPEFGPDGYLQQAPYTRQPVANLAELNRWMAIRQRQNLVSIVEG
jgi:sugar phosphate isomerase/epimerase